MPQATPGATSPNLRNLTYLLLELEADPNFDEHLQDPDIRNWYETARQQVQDHHLQTTGGEPAQPATRKPRRRFLPRWFVGRKNEG